MSQSTRTLFAISLLVLFATGCISESEAALIVKDFTENGVTLWDTAEGYGGGTSEKRLGPLKDNDSTILMTKFLPVPWRGLFPGDAS